MTTAPSRPAIGSAGTRPDPIATSPRRRPAGATRSVRAVALVAAVFVAVVAWGWYGRSATVTQDPESEGRLLSALYDPPTRPVESALNARDGQTFAALAVDPTLRRPELIRGGPGEQAYRHQRPLLGWVGWALSGGRPDAVPWALVVASGASVVAMVAAAAAALRRLGAAPTAAALLLVLPGTLADITFVGPEALGCSLLLVGLMAWTRSPRTARTTALAVVAFGLAGLCRETMLVVPAALAVRELMAGRVRATAVLAASAAPYVAWVLALRAIVGSWPVGSVPGRLTAVPFAGLVEAAPGWPPGEWVAIGGTLALGVAGTVLGRDPTWRLVAGANVAMAVVLGQPVWARSADVGRVLLPAAVLGLVALASRVATPSDQDVPVPT